MPEKVDLMAQDGGVDPHNISVALGFLDRCQRRLTSSCVLVTPAGFERPRPPSLAASVDLIDLSGGMCFYFRPGHLEPGYFSSMSEKVKARVSVPVLLTGGVQHAADAEKLLSSGKEDLIGVGRALLKDAHWRETA